MAPENHFPNDSGTQSSIPIIDFARWNSTNSCENRKIVAKELVEACRRVGFVYIVNHGVSPESVAEAFTWSKKLFDLKLEEKLLAPHPDGYAVHRGYSWPGLEKVSQIGHMGGEYSAGTIKDNDISDYKESFEIGSETNNNQPNIWLPAEILPGFRAFMNRFYWECYSASLTLLRAIAIGIGLEDEDFFMQFHSGQNNQLRLLHYPPVPIEALQKQSLARMPAHTDWGSITMLFQDDCGGLEVEDPSKQGHFVFANPFPGSLVMNIGDLLQRWSNNQLKSTLHRVVAPPEQTTHQNLSSPPKSAQSASQPTHSQRLTRSRYSIPYFISPDVEAVVECIPTCTDDEHPVLYSPVVESEYRLMRASVQYPTSTKSKPTQNGFGENDRRRGRGGSAMVPVA